MSMILMSRLIECRLLIISVDKMRILRLGFKYFISSLIIVIICLFRFLNICLNIIYDILLLLNVYITNIDIILF